MNLIKRSVFFGLITALCSALRADAAPSSTMAALQPFIDNHVVAGVVTLVASNEKVLSVEASGWMDLTKKQPMRTDCLFWIASQTKPFTGTAVMILVEQGKINVDDPVTKYLPEFKEQWVRVEADAEHQLLRRPRRPLLVRDVLTHTSGLPFNSPLEITGDLLPLESRVRAYAMIPLASEPGEKYSYSNGGINIAGRIVEVVTGMPFEKFLDEQILKPLGLKDTTFWPNSAQLARLAKSYKPTPNGLEECLVNQLRYPLDDHTRQSFPAGGLFSTANDLAIFYQMLANGGVYQGHRILSAESVRTMTKNQSGIAQNPYGFGFATDGNFFGHSGAYGSHTRYDKKTGLITVFLVQQAKWENGGEKMLSIFQTAAAATFASSAAGANPETK